MNAWRHLFTEHPASVSENYFQHLLMAWTFGIRMIVGGLVCLIHGLLPFVFCTAASDTIGDLYERMIATRRQLAKGRPYAGDARRLA